MNGAGVTLRRVVARRRTGLVSDLMNKSRLMMARFEVFEFVVSRNKGASVMASCRPEPALR